MADNQSIAQRALDLLALQPRQAGLTIALAGGGPDIVLPGPDPTGILLLARSPKLLRAAEARSRFDLQVFVDEHDGLYNLRIERVTGMAPLATIPDPTDVVAHHTAGDLNEAVDWLSSALDQHFAGVDLSVNRLSYRANRFAECQLDAARGTPPGRFSLWRPADSQIANFASSVVDRALNWGPKARQAESLSLWFYPTGGAAAVYVTVSPEPGGRYSVNITDRVVWPWKDKALSKRVPSAADVQKAVAGYLSTTHAFRVHAWHVYFNHTVRQVESDVDAWV